MKATQVLKKISTALGLKVELEQMKLVDGVTILEAESFEVGAEVFISMDEEMVPLPIGEYELEDGRMLVVEQEGIIANVTEGDAETPEESVGEPAEVEQGADRLPKKVVDSIVQEKYFKKVEAGKKKYEDEGAGSPEDVVPSDVATTVEDAEAEVTEEVVAIIEELTPDSVAEGDAAEIANDVIVAITDTLTAMPEDVAASALSKVKKYGRTKMSDEQAQVVEEAQAQLVDAVAEAVNTGTPEDVTPEMSTEIAQTIVEAVTEIVSEQPAELSRQLFRKEKPVKKSKVKNSAVSKRVEMAKERIKKMELENKKPAAKKINYNPEKTKKHELKFKVSNKRETGMIDTIFNKLFN